MKRTTNQRYLVCFSRLTLSGIAGSGGRGGWCWPAGCSCGRMARGHNAGVCFGSCGGKRSQEVVGRTCSTVGGVSCGASGLARRGDSCCGRHRGLSERGGGG